MEVKSLEKTNLFGDLYGILITLAGFGTLIVGVAMLAFGILFLIFEENGMSFLADKRKRKIFIITTSVVLALAIVVGACAIYLCDYYRADNEAIGAFLPQGTTWKEEPDGTIVFEPEGATKGFIFYPGGKVEYTAYVPLMQACAEQGILCVLVEMPFNLAVLNVNAANGIQEKYPEIEDWYIGGHSLGGSMAASYLEKNAED